MKVLVTGGKGYIGSHIMKALSDSNIEAMSFDIKDGHEIRNFDALDNFIKDYGPFTHVVHAAGVKSVTESINNPTKYHEINIGGTRVLLTAMKKHKINNIIFASSATVYNDAMNEEAKLFPSTPYGISKLVSEEYIMNSGFNYAILRYFNPIGHWKGLRETLESPNLFPSCMRCHENNETINIYGNCTRDYFFVGDLARFHVNLIVSQFDKLVLNFGTGKGLTTNEFIAHFERVNNVTLNKSYHPPRSGDKEVCVADVTKLMTLFPNFQFSDINRWFVINPDD